MTGRNEAAVTLKDVAEQAGLSVAAASLALSGSSRIPDATRERVRSAADALGYTPNRAARALRSSRHGAIGLFVFDPGSALGLSFYSEAVLAVADEALRQDLALALVNAWPHSRNSRSGLSRAVLSARVDAAVCIGGGFTIEDAHQLERRGLPYIFIGKRELPGVDVPYVSTNYLQGARLATTHLLALGHRRVAVGVRPGDLDRPWIRDRVAGHALALREAGLPESAGPLIELPTAAAGDTDVTDGAERDARRWLADGITAIFVTDHGPAGLLLRALRLQGIDVPRQIAVVGFDDPPGADLLLPPLTTVRQPLAALGAAAARTVIAWAGGTPRQPNATMLEPSLVVRHSCGAHLRLNGHSHN